MRWDRSCSSATCQHGSTPRLARQLWVGLRNRKQTQALHWAQTLDELAGLPPEKLRQVVEDNPVIAQMVDLAWEEAARTASEDKRRLLAKVVAGALRGDADAEIDALPFLLRTVMALDPGHITLLVIIATPRKAAAALLSPSDIPGPEFENAAGRDELLDRWAAADDLLDLALAALEREGLTNGVKKGRSPAICQQITTSGRTNTLRGDRLEKFAA